MFQLFNPFEEEYQDFFDRYNVEDNMEEFSEK